MRFASLFAMMSPHVILPEALQARVSAGAQAVRVANLVARGADPSVRYTAVQGHFSVVGIAVR